MKRAEITIEGSNFPIQNIFCIGRNYAKHIAELNNATPTEPLVFLKPTSALAVEGDLITLPSFSDAIHYEAELVIYIKEDAKNLSEESALSIIGGYGVGLDLTARDLQDQIKERGEPWTKCKGFPGAAIVSTFISADKIKDPTDITFTFKQNGELKQNGHSKMMLYPITEIIAYLSTIYGLSKGDIIYTGTPEGVGKLAPGDQLSLTLEDQITANFKVNAS
ncbi:isomerase [Ignatzschineria indica]|uniref:Isomerase/hydrolase n=1 Tax=Ignatzschineria indica TaxID=472583 RepID=A0A2U2ALK8_9GAMM|nr:fumarylacetoacetate hydrolase family protein [Ignatzschineria indica]PWD84100.1 isomerase/hydrolase [Ignatzschineria indica]GGZ73852.1 isomerase [Ignatzschineria indica]